MNEIFCLNNEKWALMKKNVEIWNLLKGIVELKQDGRKGFKMLRKKMLSFNEEMPTLMMEEESYNIRSTGGNNNKLTHQDLVKKNARS